MSERRFVGRVGRTVAETDYKYEKIEKHPKDSPNVVYIVLDDLGFAGLGCYGSNIHTPNIDKLAAEGLRYNNFHTTAICSATRASLLTGANHHTVGVSAVVEMTTGCSNGTGRIDDSYATLAEILHEYDYSTFAAGKWHLSFHKTPSGPYNDWPLGKGFERFYGFLQGETDQFNPILVRDNSFVTQPKKAKEGYHISEDITDNAIDFIYTQKNAYPDKPFFLYLAYGAMHTPHHAPKEYIDRYKGKFDEGWDVIREQWFQNQKKLGIIPEDAELTERAPYIDAWDSLSEKQKKVYARYMESFAGFLEHTDEQIGRVIDYLESIGQLENTVIVLISDNGASSEGGKFGQFNANGEVDIVGMRDGKEAIDFAYDNLDKIGSEYAFNHYPTGWANALNTPFQWYKCWAHEGGVKDPLIISYPKMIADKGGIRPQYHHVSDITPTILDLIGIEKPESIKGVTQKPFTGISMKYTFASADEKDRRLVQYYEMNGNRGIYKDGWKAVVNHTFSGGFEKDKWELYHTAEDYSEKFDVAEKYPEKLRELEEEFFVQAGMYNVFPMAEGTIARVEEADGFHNNGEISENEVVFRNMFKPFQFGGNTFEPYGENSSNRVNMDSADHYVSVDIKRSSNDEGVILSSGDRFGGFTFYIKDNRLKYVYNANSIEYFTAESEEELPDGELNVRFDFKMLESESAEVTLSVNGKKVGGTKITRLYFMKGFSTAIRANFYTAVSPEYEVPFEFTGDIVKLTIHSYPSMTPFATRRKQSMKKAMHQE